MKLRPIPLLIIVCILHQFSLNGQERQEFENLKISKEKVFVKFDNNQKERLESFLNKKLSNENEVGWVKIEHKKITDEKFEQRRKKLAHVLEIDSSNIEPVFINGDAELVFNDEFFVQTNSIEEIENSLKEYNYSLRPIGRINSTYLIKIPSLSYPDNFALLEKLKKNKLFGLVEPNFISYSKAHTADPYYSYQWGIKNTTQLGGTNDADSDVEEAWTYSTGLGAKIAVFDVGVQLDHPDLTANLLSGYDATGGGSQGGPTLDTQAKSAHGTACAGIAAAVSNNSGIAGVAYGAKILPVRIGYIDSGQLITQPSWIIDALSWADNNGADVITNSYDVGLVNQMLSLNIESLTINGRSGKGTAIIWSSGNHYSLSQTQVKYPGNLDAVIAVGASNFCDKRKALSDLCDNYANWGSNYGPHLDIVAPGSRMYTTDLTGIRGFNGAPTNSGGDYEAEFQGSSAAAPFVAGIAALLISLDNTLTQPEIRSLLESTAEKVGGYNYNTTKPNGSWHQEMGYGRVNAVKAVEELLFEGASLNGNNLVCSSNVTYTLSEQPTGGSLTWTVSPNLTIVSSTAYSITVKRNPNSTTGSSGYITGSSFSKSFSKSVWVGEPNVYTADYQYTYNYPVSYSTETIYVYSNASYPVTYSWSVFPSNIQWTSYNNWITFYTNQEGSYVFTVTATNGCGSFNQFYVVNIGDSGFEIESVMAFPNPATDEINVEIKEKNIKNKPIKKDYLVEIYDQDGFKFHSEKSQEKKRKVPISDWPRGQYILRVTDYKKIISQHIVIN